MTTKFVTVYTALRTYLGGTLFSTKLEIPNPYALESAAIGQLRDGWGLTVGSSTPDLGEFHTIADRTRFNVILAREVVSTEADPGALHTAVAALKDDARILYAALDGGSILNLPTDCDNIQYLGTSEVVPGTGERHKWVSLTVAFTLWTTETLS